MNDVLATILEDREVVGADGARYPVHSEIPAADGELLQSVVRRARPRRSIEIGLAYGISALYLCDALREVGAERHIVVDPLQHGEQDDAVPTQWDRDEWEPRAWRPESGWRGIGLLNLERAGHADLVEHVAAPSHQALPQLVRDGVRVDFAFVDGWHTFDYVLLDFFYLDLMLEVGGLIAFDDANYPAIRKVLRYVLTNRHYEVIEDQRVDPGPRSLAYRVTRRVADRSRRLRRGLAPEVTARDQDLGLPPGRCIVLRKLGDDVLGDGSMGSRSWNDHEEF